LSITNFVKENPENFDIIPEGLELLDKFLVKTIDDYKRQAVMCKITKALL
jgi:hypothetical protein